MTDNEKLTAMYEITNLELLSDILIQLEWLSSVISSFLVIAIVLGVIYLYKEYTK